MVIRYDIYFLSYYYLFANITYLLLNAFKCLYCYIVYKYRIISSKSDYWKSQQSVLKACNGMETNFTVVNSD